MTNYADLAMGNAIRIYRSEHDEAGEVGPHISSRYTLADTPAGPLECEVWREFDMSSGEPRLIWAARYYRHGVDLAHHEIKDAGLMGEQRPIESVGNLFTQWAAVRMRIRKVDKRLIDWPTTKDLYDDFVGWANRRGAADIPSLKAFSIRIREVDGVHPKRAGRRGFHMQFVDLVGVDDRPAAPLADAGNATPEQLQRARYAEENAAVEAMLAKQEARRERDRLRAIEKAKNPLFPKSEKDA